MRADLASRSQQLEQMQAATSSQSSSRLEQQLADAEHQFNELLTGVSPGSLRSEIDGTKAVCFNVRIGPKLCVTRSMSKNYIVQYTSTVQYCSIVIHYIIEHYHFDTLYL